MTMKLPLLVLLAALSACGTPGPPAGTAQEDKNDLVDPAIMVTRIHAQEDSLFAKDTFDKRGAHALLDVYKLFAATFPTDTMAPEYLFRAAGLAKAMNDPGQSVLLYDRILAEHPGWKRLVSAYYMKAFTIDDGLNDKERAKAAYEEVIAKFPDHAFARDARAMIDNLPYTDEQLIERFKQQEQQQARKP